MPLKNVLNAFANKYPRIGYFSGVNAVAANLLRYLDEEETFKTLCITFERILPPNYYADIINKRITSNLFDQSLKKIAPELYNKYENSGLDSIAFTTLWFIALYNYNFPLDVSDHILDLLFLCGPKILFRAALAILLLNKVELLTLDNNDLIMVSLL